MRRWRSPGRCCSWPAVPASRRSTAARVTPPRSRTTAATAATTAAGGRRPPAGHDRCHRAAADHRGGGLADLPACPVDARSTATIRRDRVVFWHAMPIENRGRAAARHRRLQREPGQGARHPAEPGRLRGDRSTSTCSPARRSRRRGADARVHDPDDDRHQHRRCPSRRASRPRVRHVDVPARGRCSAYTTRGVQWGMPFNVCDPVLLYSKGIFEAAGLDPDDPPATLDDVRADSQQIVDSGAAQLRPGARQRLRLRRRLVHRAVVRPAGRVLRRQRERARGAGDPGAVRQRHRSRPADAGAGAGHRRPRRLRRRQRRRRTDAC